MLTNSKKRTEQLDIAGAYYVFVPIP